MATIQSSHPTAWETVGGTGSPTVAPSAIRMTTLEKRGVIQLLVLLAWAIMPSKLWNQLYLPDVDQGDQRFLVVLLDFIGMLGAVNNVSGLSMDVWSSVKETGASFDRVIGIVGNCNLPQSKWFRQAYATVNNITSATLDTVPHDMTRLTLVTLCSLWRLYLALISITFIPSEFSFAMVSKNAPNSASWVSDIHSYVGLLIGVSTRTDLSSYSTICLLRLKT